MKNTLRKVDEFELLESDMETITEPSMNEEEAGLSLREIIERSVSGQDYPLGRRAAFARYSDDDDFDQPDIEKLASADLADLDQLRAENEAFISDATEKIKSFKKRKEKVKPSDEGLSTASGTDERSDQSAKSGTQPENEGLTDGK